MVFYLSKDSRIQGFLLMKNRKNNYPIIPKSVEKTNYIE